MLDTTALVVCYSVGGACLTAFALAIQDGALALLWPALALGAVALAYAWPNLRFFAKGPNGHITPAVRLLLAPYLAAAWLNARLWTRGEPRIVEIADGVWLGRYPSARDCAGMATVVDLTCEFSRPRGPSRWIAIPMLDLVAPDAASLRAAADAIEAAWSRGPVLVCCALGYGRSAAAVATWLVRSARAVDLSAALRHIRLRRPRMAVNEQQRQAIAEAIHAP
jgi:protein-tyrosine phosphatase